MITKKKLEFAGRKLLEDDKKKSKDPVASSDDKKTIPKDLKIKNSIKNKQKDPDSQKKEQEEVKVMDVIELSSDDDDGDEFASLTDTELTEMLEQRKKELEIFQRHKAEKAQLIDFTAKWKEVGNDALETLVGYYKMGRGELMRKMRLDEDIFD